jgi:hypothetical protein
MQMFGIKKGMAALALAVLIALSAAVPVAGAGALERPFKGTIVGGGVAVVDASCAVGVRTDSWGTGQVTHLGRITLVSSHCQAPMGEVIRGGVSTLVAANGDTLEVTYSVMADPFEFSEGAILTGTSPNVITGGTGRFAGASGTYLMHFRGVLHLTAPMELTWWFDDGEISY